MELFAKSERGQMGLNQSEVALGASRKRKGTPGGEENGRLDTPGKYSDTKQKLPRTRGNRDRVGKTGKSLKKKNPERKLPTQKSLQKRGTPKNEGGGKAREGEFLTRKEKKCP